MNIGGWTSGSMADTGDTATTVDIDGWTSAARWTPAKTKKCFLELRAAHYIKDRNKR